MIGSRTTWPKRWKSPASARCRRLCWVFADREGHIGRQANGWFPDRSKQVQRSVADSGLGRAQSLARPAVEPKCCRAAYDPPEGFVASANEDINPPGGPRLVTLVVPDYRRRRIDERLAALPTSHARRHASACNTTSSACKPANLMPVFLPHCPTGEIKHGWPLGIAAIRPSSVEATWFSRLVSQRAAGDFRPGAGHRLAADALSVHARRLFDDGADVHRSAVDARRSIWWQGRDKGRFDSPRGREACRPSLTALERDQRLSFHQSLSSKAASFGRALGFQHRRNWRCPAAMPRPFKAIC